MSIPTTTATILWQPTRPWDAYLPEGPREISITGRECLAWVNIQEGPQATHGAIHLRFWDTGHHEYHPLPVRPGFFVPTASGKLFVGGDTQLGTYDPITRHWETVADIGHFAPPGWMINDGELLPDGLGAIFGAKDPLFKTPLAPLFYFDATSQQTTIIRPGQTCSNGKVIHPLDDQRYTVFDIDTPTKQVSENIFNRQTCELTQTSIALDLTGYDSYPDGMIDGGPGRVLIAFYDPRAVASGHAILFDLQSKAPIHQWKLPGSPRVTCPCLLRNGQIAFTTADEGMPEEQHPLSPNRGSLLVASAQELTAGYPDVKLKNF